MRGAAPRVLYVGQHLDVGGAEELVKSYVRHLPARGFQPGVVCLTRVGRIAAEIKASGAPFWLLEGEPGPRNPAALLRLVRLLRELRPDVVHTFLLVAGLYGRLAAVAARVPLVVATEANVYAHKAPRHVWLERLLGRYTYRVIASSRAVQAFASRHTWVPASRMPVLYNAVDFAALEPRPGRAEARLQLGLPRDALLIGSVARLTDQKGHRFLLDAFAALATRFPQAQLLLVGDGPLESSLRDQARVLGVADRAHFFGVRRDLGTILSALDVFALASLWEGLPLSALWAMGCALAVVATCVGGTAEAIQDGESGLLVPPGDAAALSSSLQVLLGDLELRARLGAEAERRVRARFGVESHLDTLSALYRAGLAERGRPS